MSLSNCPNIISKKILNIVDDKILQEAVEELETDDATDLIQSIEAIDADKANAILENLHEEDKEDINWLKQYEEDEAGAFMQTELFFAYKDERVADAKNRLIEEKKNGKLENVHCLFVKDDNESLLATIPFEELFILDYETCFKELIDNDNKKNSEPICVKGNTPIEDVIRLFSDYDVPVIPVVGYKRRLVGRITADDIHDIIEESATEQIYHLAGLGDSSDYQDGFFNTFKDRLIWLLINLMTAILASFVISFF